MIALAAAPVTIHTSPADVPSVPAWFAEVTVLARHFAQRGLLDAISQQVRLARGRAGHYDVIDFVALLLGYAVSGEATIAAFVDRLAPFAGPFMALFGRDDRPHRATLSRFLAAVDAPCLAALRQLVLQDLGHYGVAGEDLGGLLDRQGQRLLIVDVDGTRQAARQRALATAADLPAPQRRRPPACAPGYTGRQRGEVVRTRTTVLQAHTQEWLGTFGGAGNGDYSMELEAACRAVTAYLAAKGLRPEDGLLRLDGLYGTATPLARVQSFGLGFVVRGRDYQLLNHPAVQARLQQPCELVVTHPETQVCREVFDIGTVADWLEPVPGLALTCRVVVTRRAAPAAPAASAIGKLVEGHIYELFLTTRPTHSLTAADVLDLYHGRGAFEQVLSDEDTEQDPDRWCSHQPQGQEFWQVLSQWVWNARLELGRVCQPLPPRWTRWADHTPVCDPPSPLPMPAPRDEPPAPDLVAVYGPLEWASAGATARDRFAGPDFTVVDAATLRCPAGNVLRLGERRSLEHGDVRVYFSARAGACRACPLAERCLGRGAAGTTPRRVSAVQRLLGRYARPAPAVPAAPPEGTDQQDLLWGDGGGRRLRRDLVRQLRRQTVTIEVLPGRPPVPAAEPRVWTRAERAHRRLSWATRLARNALPVGTATSRVRLFGIAPALAKFLGLPSLVVG